MDSQRLTLESKFKFSCHKGLACYTRCCRDINILLTPYDILRIKNRLNFSSEEFLEKYTLFSMGNNPIFPLIQLKMEDNEDKGCPFVKADGCLIYEDRPWACRMYPLGQATNKEEDMEFYFFVREEHCLGFNENKGWTVNEWENNQGVKVYNEMNELFKEITLNPKLHKPLDIDKLEMAFMTCYNLDKFKRFIFESKFLKVFDIKEELIERIKIDEVELMKFGFCWLKFVLFGENTMKIMQVN
ncbi:MAG: YkgJ family cysteine cluster protein [Nitrospirota bacterium]